MTEEFTDEQSASGSLLHEMRETVEALDYLKLFAQRAAGEPTMPQIAALAEDSVTRLRERCEVLARDLPSLAASAEHRHYYEAIMDALAVVHTYRKRVRAVGGLATFLADLDGVVTRLKLAHQVLTGFIPGKPLLKHQQG